MARLRKVRTAAGEKRFGQPIGSIILADHKLTHLTWLSDLDDNFSRVKGSNGRQYDVGYDEVNQTWVATGKDNWDKIYVDYASSEGEVYQLLDQGIADDAFRGGNVVFGDLHDHESSSHLNDDFKEMDKAHDLLKQKYGRNGTKAYSKYVATELTKYRAAARKKDHEAAQNALQAAENAAQGIDSRNRVAENQKAEYAKRKAFLDERAKRIKNDQQFGSLSLNAQAVAAMTKALDKSVPGVHGEYSIVSNGQGDYRLSIDKVTFDKNAMRTTTSNKWMRQLTDHAERHGWDIMIQPNALEMPKPLQDRLLKNNGFDEPRPNLDRGYPGEFSRRHQQSNIKKIEPRDLEVPNWDDWEYEGEWEDGSEIWGAYSDNGVYAGQIAINKDHNGDDQYTTYVDGSQHGVSVDSWEKAQDSLNAWLETLWKYAHQRDNTVANKIAAKRNQREVDGFYDFVDAPDPTGTKSARIDAAKKKSAELGITVNGFPPAQMRSYKMIGKPDPGMHPYSHEQINALAEAYETMFPGFTQYQPHYGIFTGQKYQNAYAFNNYYVGASNSAVYLNPRLGRTSLSEDDLKADLASVGDKNYEYGATWFSATSAKDIAEYWGITRQEAVLQSVLNHETGHTVGRLVYGEFGGNHEETIRRWQQNVPDIFKKHGLINNTDQMTNVDPSKAVSGRTELGLMKSNGTLTFVPGSVAENVSQYGASNFHEMIAEVWSAYILDPTPTDFVAEFGEEIESLLIQRMEELDKIRKANQS